MAKDKETAEEFGGIPIPTRGRAVRHCYRVLPYKEEGDWKVNLRFGKANAPIRRMLAKRYLAAIRTL